MNATGHPARSPRSPAASPDAPGGLESELAPVVAALWVSARSRANAISEASEQGAAAELARAGAEAERILRQARLDGTAAADQTAAILIANARRQAHEVVLLARTAAYQALRTRTLDALQEQASTPEGRRLAELLEALVRRRVGATTLARPGGAGGLSAAAERDNRRASIGPEQLLDRALQALAGEVESLWA